MLDSARALHELWAVLEADDDISVTTQTGLSGHVRLIVDLGA